MRYDSRKKEGEDSADAGTPFVLMALFVLSISVLVSGLKRTVASISYLLFLVPCLISYGLFSFPVVVAAWFVM